VPAAAVIQAPIAYIKVVAIKKLVVGFVAVASGLSPSVSACWRRHSWVEPAWHEVVMQGMPIVYCEKIRVFKAGLCR
jgi:hypothetical protein